MLRCAEQVQNLVAESIRQQMLVVAAQMHSVARAADTTLNGWKGRSTLALVAARGIGQMRYPSAMGVPLRSWKPLR